MKESKGNKELVTCMTDAIALAIRGCHDMNNTRRQAMKKELNKDYAALCNSSTVDASSEFFFGDLSKLAKDITDANKLTKKVRPSHQQGNYSRSIKYTAGGRRNSGNQSYRFSPYQRGRNDFLSTKEQNEKRGCIKAKLTHEVCPTQLPPTLNDFPPDVGLTVGYQPVFKAGRLVEFIPMWREIMSDLNVLQYVQGVKISFIEGIVPRQQAYRQSVFNGQQHEIVQNEIQSLLLKGVLRESHSETGEFVSTIFLRPNNDGSFRMILNLRQFRDGPLEK